MVNIHSVEIEVGDGNVNIFRFTTRQKNEYLEDTLPAHDHERIARFIESLAALHGFDSCPYYTERSKRYDPLAAYHLWAKRLKRAAGIVLRKPRLSVIYENHIPRDILCSRLYGERIPNLHPADIGDVDILNDLVACGREDVLVIEEAEMGVLTVVDEYGHYRSGPGFTPASGLVHCYPRTRPLFFTRENAGLMLARLRKHLPERDWQALTLAHLAADLLGMALAA